MRVEGKVAIAAIVIIAGYFGYGKWTAWQVTKIPTPPIAPGKFDLLGLKPSEEYSTRIASGTAFIVRGADPNGSFSDQGDKGAAGDRIPTADVLKAKGGDVDALGQLATRMNELVRGDPPADAVAWSQAEIERALGGDQQLRARLARDLAMRLKPGEPTPEVTPKALDNGILIRIDIPVTFDLPGGRRTVIAHADVPYRPQAVLNIQEQLKNQFVSGQEEVGVFQRQAAGSNEDLTAELRAIYAPSKTKRYGEVVADLLDTTFIILTERHITGASVETVPPAPYKTNSTYNLHMDLTPEGRARVWKYSNEYGGGRVLVLVEGVSAEGSLLTRNLNVPSLDITQLINQDGVNAVVKLASHKGT